MPNDTFIYKPKTLNAKEMIYVNSLMISYSKKWIGFGSPQKVFSSFLYCLEHESEYRSVTKLNESTKDVVKNYFNNLAKSRFNKIIKWCIDQGCQTEQNVFVLFEELTSNIFRDFDTNIYIYDYYLNRYDETYNFDKLDFLGGGDKNKKMEFLITRYNLLLSERGGTI